jgi:hypothetical protein
LCYAVEIARERAFVTIPMLSHRFQTIFVHVPKTAGQSIETVFLEQHALTWRTRGELLLRPNADRALGPERLAHLYASEYVACGHISPREFERYFKFAVVRNPYDRASSEYRFRKPEGARSFRAFLDTIPEDDYDDIARHMAPQVKFVCGHDGHLLVDRVLHYETLQQEIEGVFEQVFGAAPVLPHVNRGRLSDGPALSAEDARLIYRRFEADFDFFCYPRHQK